MSKSDLLLGVRPVCQRWSRLSKDECLWTSLELTSLFRGSGHLDKLTNTKTVKSLFANIGHCIERITFNNIPLESKAYELFCKPGVSSDLQDTFPKLVSLDYSYSSVIISDLRRALTTYPLITELILVHTTVTLTDAIDEVLLLTNLKKFIFRDLHPWECFLEESHHAAHTTSSAQRLMLIPKACPQLEWFELHTIWADLTDRLIQRFFMICPNLKRFYFTWSGQLTESAFQNPDLKGNGSLTEVTHLGMADRQGHSAYLNFVLPHFLCLTSLTLEGYQYHILIEDCVAIGECCPKLEELIFHIKDYPTIDRNYVFTSLLQSDALLTSPKLQEIAQRCSFLKKLHAPCSEVDNDGFFNLVHHCPHLEDINFMFCQNLTDRCLQIMADHLPNLQRVNFQCTFTLQRNIEKIFSSCLNLKEAIFDCVSKDEEDSMGLARPTLCDQPAAALTFSSHAYSASKLSSTLSRNGNSLTYPQSPHIDEQDLPFIDMADIDGTSENSNNPDSTLQAADSTPSLIYTKNEYYEGLSFETPYLFKDYDPVLPVPVPAVHCHITTLLLKDSIISGKALETIFNLCPDLTYVDVSGCLGLNDILVETLAVRCRRLKILMISGSLFPVSDKGLQALSTHSKNLEEVSILNNYYITRHGISSLLNSLPHLRSLSFCIGHRFKYILPIPDGDWQKYLTRHSAKTLEQTLVKQTNLYFRVLHLEFVPRNLRNP